MAQQIQLRNDTTSAWETENPVLAQAEIGVDVTTGQFKIGDGESSWTELDYHANASLEVPTAIKDTNGDDLIVFEKGGTGVARIHAVQDDLALRSARDIILYPGDDGPGNVYINWGDATIAPDATNRVATLADINSAPKTWTTTNDVEYKTYQANGGIEIEPTPSNNAFEELYAGVQTTNERYVNLYVTEATNTILAGIVNGTTHFRRASIFLTGPGTVALSDFFFVSQDDNGYLWQFVTDATVSVDTETLYEFSLDYDGAPVVWWDADTLGLITDSNNYWHFRGAKIEYHAYAADSGTIIGTIYIAHDSGRHNITHLETSSGGSDMGTVSLWNRGTNYSEERKVFLYRTDGESGIHRIQWTAQVYYSTDYYDN